MIDLHTYFDYMSTMQKIDHRTTLLAVFGIDYRGPKVLLSEDGKRLGLDDIVLDNLSIHSIIAGTQGDNYRDEVMLLPVMNRIGYHCLVVSTVLPGEDPVHQRYRQVALLLPSELAASLPQYLTIAVDLLRICRRFVKLDLKQLIHLKMDLLHFLEKELLP